MVGNDLSPDTAQNNTQYDTCARTGRASRLGASRAARWPGGWRASSRGSLARPPPRTRRSAKGGQFPTTLRTELPTHNAHAPLDHAPTPSLLTNAHASLRAQLRQSPGSRYHVPESSRRASPSSARPRATQAQRDASRPTSAMRGQSSARRRRRASARTKRAASGQCRRPQG